MAPTQSPAIKHNNQTEDKPIFQFNQMSQFGSEEHQKLVQEMNQKHVEFREQFSTHAQTSQSVKSFDEVFDFHEKDLQKINFKQDFNLSLENTIDNSFQNSKSLTAQHQTVKETESSYQISVNIEGFKVEEVKVKLLENHELVVEGKNESNEFQRSYTLPHLTNNSNITCTKAANDILNISIEKNGALKNQNTELKVKKINQNSKLKEQKIVKSCLTSTSTASSIGLSGKESSIQENKKAPSAQLQSSKLNNHVNVSIKEDKLQKQDTKHSNSPSAFSNDRQLPPPEVLNDNQLKSTSGDANPAIRKKSVKTVMTHNGPQQVFDPEPSCDESKVHCSPSSCSPTAKEEIKLKEEFNSSSHAIKNEDISKSSLSPSTSNKNENEPQNLSTYSEKLDNLSSIKSKLNEANLFKSVPNNLGLFVEDPFFSDVHEDYLSTIKSILPEPTNSKPTSSSLLSCMDDYFNFRLANTTQQTRAVRHIEDEHSHKVILDVKGYNTENISITINSDNTLVIEGHFEDISSNSSMKKSFKHMFNVSNFDVEKVSSALSKDNILTVKIPKMVSDHPSVAIDVSSSLSSLNSLSSEINNQKNVNHGSENQLVTSNPAGVSKSSYETENASSSIKSESESLLSSNIVSSKQSSFSSSSQMASSSSSSNQESVIVKNKSSNSISSEKISSDSKISTNKASIQESQSSSSMSSSCSSYQSTNSSVSSQNHSSSQKCSQVGTVLSSDIGREIMNESMNIDNMELLQQMNKSSNLKDIDLSTIATNKKYETNTDNSQISIMDQIDNALAIHPLSMGSFFDDSFFKEMHTEFNAAMEHILAKRDMTSTSISDNFLKYENLRSLDISQNRAIQHTEDDRCHKIVLDVKGYNRNDLSIKIDDNDTLVIEGIFEDKSDNSVKKKNFKHMFKVSSFDINNVKSALSKDEILTVTIQKVTSIS